MENEAGWNLLISGSAQPLPLNVAEIKEEVEEVSAQKSEFLQGGCGGGGIILENSSTYEHT